MTGAGEQPLAGIVLAAGAGQRLRPLTLLRPKALCPVGQRALVDHATDRVRPHAGDIAVNVHAHADMMLDHLGHAAPGVHVSVEAPRALGTAGALGHLRDWIDGRGVLVTNADAWSRDPLEDLVGGWDGERVRLLVVRDEQRGDFGPWRYAGACVMPWRAVRTLTSEPTGLYEVCWRHEELAGRLDLCPSDAVFVDCGTAADYLAANMDWSGGENVVGADAVVEGRLRRCVVWPRGVVQAGEDLVEVIRAGTDLTVSGAG